MAILTLLSALALAPQAAGGVVEVPFRIADDALVVDAVVNGRKASFMFDTGFAGCAVVSDAIELGPPTGTVMLRDFVGEFAAKSVKVKSLQLGPLKIDPTGMNAIQQPLGSMSQGYNMHTDGIMGLEVIKKYVTKFDFEKQRFVFYPKSTDISIRTPDNKRTFMGKLLPIGNDSLEMLVTAPNGKTMVMALDTGNAFFATTHKDVLQRAGLWPKDKQPNFMKVSGVASGAVDSFDVEMPPVTIFGIPVPVSVWSVIDRPSSSAEGDGTIGFKFLRNFNFTIDFDRRRVWFENFTGKTGLEPAAEVGIMGGYRPSKKRVEVWRVTPGSPAAAAGIRQGDELISVDDENLNQTTFRRVSDLMEGPAGSKVKIAISRNGELKRFEIERTLLVNKIETG